VMMESILGTVQPWTLEPGQERVHDLHINLFADGRILFWQPGDGRPTEYWARWQDSEGRVQTEFGGRASELNGTLEGLDHRTIDVGHLVDYAQRRSDQR